MNEHVASEEEINAGMAKFYDMYETDKGEDASFWLEYEAHMSQPVNETDILIKLVDFVGA